MTQTQTFDPPARRDHVAERIAFEKGYRDGRNGLKCPPRGVLQRSQGWTVYEETAYMNGIEEARERKGVGKC